MLEENREFSKNLVEEIVTDRALINEDEQMEFDVVVVGGGIAGLSFVIRSMQLAQESGAELNICLLEKGSEIGAHVLSGNVLEPRSLDELLPDWRNMDSPIKTEVKKDEFLKLSKSGKLKLPTPKQMHNKGNYIISLSDTCRWLGTIAEEMGVQIFAGYPAAKILYNHDKSKVLGVVTGEFGVGKDGQKKDSYQAGLKIFAKQTIFAEGCRGHLTKQLEDNFSLRAGATPQTYALGIKEIWKIKPENHDLGKVTHTIGWPLDSQTYGGSFIYHIEGSKLAIGYVIGLDYKNPFLNPYQEFQKFKTHPYLASLLDGGERIAYGARALNEGGYQAIPKLTFNGGLLIGCSAGFLNVPKIKGTHTAMKSAMIAAEEVFAHLTNDKSAEEFSGCGHEVSSYEEKLKESWVYKELYYARNIRPSFKKGLYFGLLYSAIDTYLLFGNAPWTFTHHRDNEQTGKAKDYSPIDYPKADGKLTFDILSSVYLANTYHEEDQPPHLTLRDKNIPLTVNLKEFAEPAQRFCPAKVYEIVEDSRYSHEDSQLNGKKLQINAQNCIHCKTCDIKDYSQNINWLTPEGTGGPNYSGM